MVFVTIDVVRLPHDIFDQEERAHEELAAKYAVDDDDWDEGGK